MLRIQIRDPVPFQSVDPGSGMEKNPEPGSSDLIFENLVSVFWVKILKFCDANRSRIRDRENRNRDPGSGINIPDPQHWKSGKDWVQGFPARLLIEETKELDVYATEFS
jgi:hypothetical protein